MRKGCVHIYTGDGKGKTTAAVGLAVRAAGSGLRVVFAQFLKGRPTGELAPLRQIGVTVLRTDDVVKFIPDMNGEERERCRLSQRECLERVKEQIPRCDVLILDEIIGAVGTSMIGLDEVTRLIREKPEALELVLTGREPPKELTELADYISDIRAVRHPYDKGIPARRGIEY